MAPEEQVVNLFDPAPEQDDPETNPEDVLGPYGRRARLVRFSQEVIGGEVAGDVKRRVRLNLFPATQEVFTRAVEPIALLEAPISDGDVKTIRGRLEDEPYARLNIVIVGDVINLHLFSPTAGQYEAEPFGGSTYIVREIDEAKVPDCGTEVEVEEGDGEPEEDTDEESSPSLKSNPFAKLLIVYTSKLKDKTALKSEEGVKARAALAVQVGNDVLRDSLVDVRLQLAATVELPDYSEKPDKDGYYTMLDELESGNARGLKHLHKLRDDHQADLVSLLVYNPDLGGLANIMGFPRSSFEKRAYSIVNYRVAASTWTLVHEIGHNFGCCHENGCGSDAKTYARGYTFKADGKTWKTVMVRKSVQGDRIPYFSNPSQTYMGEKTGDDQHNNARVIKEATSTIESFRPRRAISVEPEPQSLA